MDTDTSGEFLWGEKSREEAEEELLTPEKHEASVPLQIKNVL